MGLPKIALPGCHGDRHASIYSSVFSCLLLLLLLLLTTHKATWEGCLNFCGGFFFFVVGILGLFSLIGPVCVVNPIQCFMETDQAGGLCVVLFGSL